MDSRCISTVFNAYGGVWPPVRRTSHIVCDNVAGEVNAKRGKTRGRLFSDCSCMPTAAFAFRWGLPIIECCWLLF